MPKGQQPNKQEIEDNIQKTAEELEKMTPPSPENPDPEGKPEEEFKDPEKQPIDTPPAEPTPEPEKKEEKKEEEPEKPPKKEEKPKEGEEPEKPPKQPTPEERQRHSTAEAQILTSQNRRLETAILEADELPEPTDEEMMEAEPTWEEMTPTEQKLARKVLHNEKKNAIIAKAGKEGALVNQWMDKVDVYLADPKTLTDHPELEGREEEFKTFSIKPTRRGADFEDLVAAFLYSQKLEPVTPKKEKMFETGGAPGDGERPKPNDGKISLMEARRLRVTDYPTYLKYLRGGKIDNSDI